MKIYLRILSVIYAVGGFLHLLDVFGLRLKFSELSDTWKYWIVYLLIFDFIAAVGLWQRKSWGTGLFLLIACSQLIAYVGFSETFGHQYFLVSLHLITLITFFVLKKISALPPGISSSTEEC